MTTLELTPAQTRMIAEQHHDSQQTEINKLKTRVEQLETTLARTVANLDSCEHDRDHFKREAVKLADVIAEVTRTVSSGLQTWGRVEDIPAHVAEFYDKEGDKWARDGYKYTCKLLSGPRSASFVNKYGPFTAKR